MDEKYLRYRAARISKNQGISLEDALAIAEQEVATDRAAEKQAKSEKHKAASKKLTQKLKRNNKKTTYVVGGSVVDRVVSGGLPTLGRRR
jgi:hypothetical protein